MKYTTRPLSDRTWLRPSHRRERARFTASWSDTLDLLERELRLIDGKDVVIECDVRERDIRLDGMIRANALPPGTPAVVVAFESRHGPLLYRSDLYSQRAYGARTTHAWQENVRAVALTLESLRAVARYGASSAGEQYRGYKALGAGTGDGIASGMTASDAEAHLLRVAGPSYIAWPGDIEVRERIVKRAKVRTHPDINGGSHAQWNLTEQAIGVLTRAGRLR